MVLKTSVSKFSYSSKMSKNCQAQLQLQLQLCWKLRQLQSQLIQPPTHPPVKVYLQTFSKHMVAHLYEYLPWLAITNLYQALPIYTRLYQANQSILMKIKFSALNWTIIVYQTSFDHVLRQQSLPDSAEFNSTMLSYTDHLILLINSMQYILIEVQSQLGLSLAQLSPSLYINKIKLEIQPLLV